MADNSTNDKAKNAPGNKPAPKKTNTKKPATTKSEGLGLPQQVDLMWTVAIAVVAFVLGFFVNSLFAGPQPGTTVPPSSGLSSSASGVSGAGGSTTAPTLTEAQVNSGQLPSGHPDLGVGTTGGTTGTTAPAMSQGQIDAATGFTKVTSGTASGHGTGASKTSDVPASSSVVPKSQSVEVPAGKDPSKK
ncbi:MAG TPA: hypothetical protein VGK02_08095 [Candidatus Aquicultor sp.]